MIGPAVGVDHHVGLEVRPGRLDQDVHALVGALAGRGVANHPAHGVARRHGDELFTGLQRNVGHLAGAGVELVERTGRERPDLVRVQIAPARGLYTSCRVGLGDAYARIDRLRRCDTDRHRLQLSGQRQRDRCLHDLHRLRRIGHVRRCDSRRVEADLRRGPGVSAGAKGQDEAASGESLRYPRGANVRNHEVLLHGPTPPSSRLQFRPLT